MILGCVQPAYLPWLAYFQRMLASDIFVHLDDVSFSKNNFHNRNRIKSNTGPITLTVPVHINHHFGELISSLEIDYSKTWARKHLQAIQLNYNKSDFYSDIINELTLIYRCEWKSLAELNISIINLIRDYLKIDTPCYRSSALNIQSKGNEKLVDLCRHFDAARFIVKPGTDHYHPKQFFLQHDIEFEYFQPQTIIYPQRHGEFIPNLSALDYIFNCGQNLKRLQKKTIV